MSGFSIENYLWLAVSSQPPWIIVLTSIVVIALFLYSYTLCHGSRRDSYADKPSLLSVNSRVRKVNERSAAYTAIHDRAAKSGDSSERLAGAQQMVDQYYDLATDFYEFGWGDSFHFAHRYANETLRESIVRHEHYLAAKLGLQEGMKCLDVGCGVGGPARNIARFSRADITGVTINQYQVSRGTAKGVKENINHLVHLQQGDFMALPFKPNTFDRAYAIEATCHAPDRTLCFKQIFDVLKPGGVFAGYEWVATSKMDWNNPDHRALKHEIEIGNGLPNITYADGVTDALTAAGFVIEECRDLALESPVSWFEPFKPALTMDGFKTTDIGIALTHIFVVILETLWLAPKGTALMHTNLTSGARGLYQGGSLGLFTPMLFFKVTKPLLDAAATKGKSISAASPSPSPKARDSSPKARASSRARVGRL